MSTNTPPNTMTTTQPIFPANALVDLEKEQEGIVLKLLHEISALKEENKMLRSMVSTNNSSSVSSSSIPSPTFNDFITLQNGAIVHSSPVSSFSSTNSTVSGSSPFLAQRRSTITTPTSLKRVPNTLIPACHTPNLSQQPISRSSSTSKARSRSNSVSSLGLSKPNFLDTEYVIRPISSSSSSKKSHKRSSSDTCPRDIISHAKLSPAHPSTTSGISRPKLSEGLLISRNK